jgi:hypothetical protein
MTAASLCLSVPRAQRTAGIHPFRTFAQRMNSKLPRRSFFQNGNYAALTRIAHARKTQICRFLRGNVPRHTPLTALGRALLAAAPEPKEGWFAPVAGHEDLADYGGLDVVVAFIERRLGG